MKTKFYTFLLTAFAALTITGGVNAQDWLYGEVDANHPWRNLNNSRLQDMGIRPKFHFNDSGGSVYFYQDPAGYYVRVSGQSIRYVDIDALWASRIRVEDHLKVSQSGYWDYKNWYASEKWFCTDGKQRVVIFWR
ncbi:MAG: hypothetical protein CMO55_18135 [Verrucomicrobiales bacterium]|nr:hypothetical protein [Verrucomicrobiales bacterium]